MSAKDDDKIYEDLFKEMIRDPDTYSDPSVFIKTIKPFYQNNKVGAIVKTVKSFFGVFGPNTAKLEALHKLFPPKYFRGSLGAFNLSTIIKNADFEEKATNEIKAYIDLETRLRQTRKQTQTVSVAKLITQSQQIQEILGHKIDLNIVERLVVLINEIQMALLDQRYSQQNKRSLQPKWDRLTSLYDGLRHKLASEPSDRIRGYERKFDIIKADIEIMQFVSKYNPTTSDCVKFINLLQELHDKIDTDINGMMSNKTTYSQLGGYITLKTLKNLNKKVKAKIQVIEGWINANKQRQQRQQRHKKEQEKRKYRREWETPWEQEHRRYEQEERRRKKFNQLDLLGNTTIKNELTNLVAEQQVQDILSVAIDYEKNYKKMALKYHPDKNKTNPTYNPGVIIILNALKQYRRNDDINEENDIILRYLQSKKKSII